MAFLKSHVIVILRNGHVFKRKGQADRESVYLVLDDAICQGENLHPD